MTQRNLRVIRGGMAKCVCVGSVRIVATVRSRLPSTVPVMVFEEDTNLIMTVDREMYYQKEHPVRIMTELYNAEKPSPGSLVRNGGSWYAVVIDLEADTICRQEWVCAAYAKVFAELEKCKYSEAAMHLLGSTYSTHSLVSGLQLLGDVLLYRPPRHLKKIRLVVDGKDQQKVQEQMQKLFSKPSLL